MKAALVIMAAGIGSRFGGGIKQLEPVGLNGEIIMDYSIHDALEAGFNKIIFIIRKDIEKEFREVIGDRIEVLCKKIDVEVEYAFQALSDVPMGVEYSPERKKPWGTGQAVLACRGLIKEPFVVINADDYYGKEAFVKIHDFLMDYKPENAWNLCMAGFILKNTLSDNGVVTRGICKMNEEEYLTQIHETHEILKTIDDGHVGAEVHGEPVDVNSLVSMNMWGLSPEFVDALEEGFKEFFAGIEKGTERELKAEYLLPIYIDELLKKDKVTVKVLKTHDKWFGVTYKEDKATVVDAFKELIKKGVYEENLFHDIVK